MDDELVEALRKDYRTAPINEQDRVMLDYVVKITKDATRCSPADHDALRAVGFDDRGILQITLITAGSTTSIAWRMRWELGGIDDERSGGRKGAFHALHCEMIISEVLCIA